MARTKSNQFADADYYLLSFAKRVGHLALRFECYYNFYDIDMDFFRDTFSNNTFIKYKRSQMLN